MTNRDCQQPGALRCVCFLGTYVDCTEVMGGDNGGNVGVVLVMDDNAPERLPAATDATGNCTGT